jgi:hypothetical protein
MNQKTPWIQCSLGHTISLSLTKRDEDSMTEFHQLKILSEDPQDFVDSKC